MSLKKFGEIAKERNAKKSKNKEIILHMICSECEKLHTLPNLESDYFCSCGNKMVEYQMHKTKIKCSHLLLKN